MTFLTRTMNIVEYKHVWTLTMAVKLISLILIGKFDVEAGRFPPRLSPRGFEPVWQCAPIKLDFCKDIGYNDTIVMTNTVPNPYTNTNSQEESHTHLTKFDLLLQTGCSKNLRLLLCSIYLPYCDRQHTVGIRACRPMCEEVKSKCSQYLEAVGHPWPEYLNCDKLPEENTNKVFCLPGDPTRPTESKPKETTAPQISKPKTTHKTVVLTNSNYGGTGAISREKYCRILYSRNVKNYIYVEKIQQCTLECMKDGLFTMEEKQLTEKWISALACICGILCCASLLCVVTNYRDTSFPERAIVFIAICYLFYSLSYIIRIVYSREGVTCQEENGRSYLLVDGSGNITCAATFLLSYCFSMVQSIWWVILCLTWFLKAGMKWTPEAIRSINHIFHALAWGVPCCKTVIVLVWRKIDVNELTGICSIGNRYENLRALRWLVLGPLFVYLIMAAMFLLFGLICLCRMPSQNDENLTTRMKVQKLTLPVTAHAVLHSVFTTIILSSYFYEYVNKNSWYNDPTSTGPNFAVFLIRIISDFSIGISAAIWLIFIHGPRTHRKMRIKLYQTDLLLPKDTAHRIPKHAQHNTGTNETSI